MIRKKITAMMISVAVLSSIVTIVAQEIGKEIKARIESSNVKILNKK